MERRSERILFSSLRKTTDCMKTKELCASAFEKLLRFSEESVCVYVRERERDLQIVKFDWFFAFGDDIHGCFHQIFRLQSRSVERRLEFQAIPDAVLARMIQRNFRSLNGYRAFAGDQLGALQCILQ